MQTMDVSTILEQAEAGITNYLQTARDSGRIDQKAYQAALENTFPNLRKWLEDPFIDAISSDSERCS